MRWRGGKGLRFRAMWDAWRSLYDEMWEERELDALRETIDAPRTALEHAPRVAFGFPYEAPAHELDLATRRKNAHAREARARKSPPVSRDYHYNHAASCSATLTHRFARLRDELTSENAPHFDRCPYCGRSVRITPSAAAPLKVEHEAPGCAAWSLLRLPSGVQ